MNDAQKRKKKKRGNNKKEGSLQLLEVAMMRAGGPSLALEVPKNFIRNAGSFWTVTYRRVSPEHIKGS